MSRFTLGCVAVFVASTLVAEAAAQGSDDGGAASVPPLALNFALAQDNAPAPAPSTDDGWRAEAYVWIWATGLDGTSGARGLTADVSASFSDLLDDSDSLFAFSGRIEVGKGRWGAYVDGMYSNLQADNQSGPVGIGRIDMTFETALIDFGLMYRIGTWTAHGQAAQNSRSTTLDLYGGGRYTNLRLTLEPAVVGSASQSVDWVDPIVGAKFVLPVSRHFHIMTSGDIGGFGAGSDFTWSATAVLGYDFTIFDQPAALYLGYRAIGQDYSTGSGANEFIWDIIQHGPLIGFSMRF